MVSLSNLQILDIQLCYLCLYSTCKYYPSSSANGVSIQPANTRYPALLLVSLLNVQILFIQLCKWCSLSNLQILDIQLCYLCLYSTCKYYPSNSANGVSIQPANTIHPTLQMVLLNILQTPIPCLLDVGHCRPMVWNHSHTNRTFTESVEYRQTEQKQKWTEGSRVGAGIAQWLERRTRD